MSYGIFPFKEEQFCCISNNLLPLSKTHNTFINIVINRGLFLFFPKSSSAEKGEYMVFSYWSARKHV